jgi:hypothetical protein
MLNLGINRPKNIKGLQNALVRLGYDLGADGVFRNGVDGKFGPTTETAVKQFQTDQGYSENNIDGVVGIITLNEMINALEGDPQIGVETQPGRVQTKREIRSLDNKEERRLLPLDFSKRKTFLNLSCNVDGANAFIDGLLLGQTPLFKKIAINPGWHRIRMVDPNAPPPEYSIPVPDFQDIYIPQGRTQNIHIKLSTADQNTTE